MSKAFVKDDEAAIEDDPPSDRTPRREGASYITPEGFRAMREELDHLWKIERPRVTSEVAEAAAQGDRSENAEYIYGKKRLAEIDRRVRYLGRRIDEATVVAPTGDHGGRAFFGAWVTVEDPEGARATYRIVGPDETEVSKGQISVESPLARALLGKGAGDEVTFARPKGQATFSIIEVAYGALSSPPAPPPSSSHIVSAPVRSR